MSKSIEAGAKEANAPHLEEDVAELLANLHQRVKRSAVSWCALRLEVVLLERRFLPFSAVN
jgi:hypothetical protein